MRKLKLFFIAFLLLFITQLVPTPRDFSLLINNCFAQWNPLPVFPTYLETSDVKFFDENTGVLFLNNIISNPIHGILRTTNGGQNWIQVKNCLNYSCQKIDSTTLYAIAQTNTYSLLYRTFNKGETWDSVGVSFDNGYNRLSFVNKDTGWVSGWISGVPYIWKTMNGGIILTIQAGSNVGGNEVFFYNQKVNGEYTGWVNNSSTLWKTTNSGNNWFQVSCPGTELYQITFINENTGWVSNGQAGMFKTINGGLNWVNQPLAPGIPNVTRSISRFCVFDSINLIGINGYKLYPLRGTALVWKTTNGGNIWGYQEIDSSYHIGFLASMDFINPNTGWAFEGNGVKTTNGGGRFTGISHQENFVSDYKLYQNYPNPFNPVTKISFDLPKDSKVKLIVYDILGREVTRLLNSEFKQAGKHIIDLDAMKFNLASGVYFYRIEIEDPTGRTGDFNAVKKMLMIK